MNLSFENWMVLVDKALQEMTGLRSGDLDDWGYWNCWSDGDNPRDVALDVMSENGYGDFT